MYSSAYVWAKILNHMENRLTPAVVSTWFDDAEVVELNDEQLILYTASPFRKEIIQRRCTEYIKDAMKEIFNTEITLVVFGPELERPICSMPLPMSFAASTRTLKSFTSRATNLPMS